MDSKYKEVLVNMYLEGVFNDGSRLFLFTMEGTGICLEVYGDHNPQWESSPLLPDPEKLLIEDVYFVGTEDHFEGIKVQFVGGEMFELYHNCCDYVSEGDEATCFGRILTPREVYRTLYGFTADEGLPGIINSYDQISPTQQLTARTEAMIKRQLRTIEGDNDQIKMQILRLTSELQMLESSIQQSEHTKRKLEEAYKALIERGVKQ